MSYKNLLSDCQCQYSETYLDRLNWTGSDPDYSSLSIAGNRFVSSYRVGSKLLAIGQHLDVAELREDNQYQIDVSRNCVAPL
jgi:hypothetical protein